MGYQHITNLYRPEAQTILLFKEVYAMEKIHGTSASVRWKEGNLSFHSGGEKHARFLSLFDTETLSAAFTSMGHPDVTIYGEAYGGSQQGMAKRYGPVLRFVAFEVQVGETWLSVPNAEDVAKRLGLEFVHYRKVSTDLASLDAERDAPSEQARRNGVVGDQPREGVVLRPLQEFTDSRGERVMAKHKRAEERETATPRNVGDPVALAAFNDAQAVANEFVVQTRLEHVLDKLPHGIGIESTGTVVRAMIDDVVRECSGEFADTKEARAAMGKRAATLFHAHLRAKK